MLAAMMPTRRSQLKGKIKLIFQPAEEGTRGARSMVLQPSTTKIFTSLQTMIGNEMMVLRMNIANSSHTETGIFDFSSRAPTSEK